MTDLPRALRACVALLERMGLPYAVMGGLAVRVYGIPRATYDIDITVAIERDRLAELYEALTALGYTVPELYASGWVDQVAGMPVVKARLFNHTGGLDLDLFLAETPYQRQLLARRVRAEVDGSTVWLVSPEDLILLKLVANRPRDQGDVADIFFVQGQLDEPYLRHWAGELGVTDRLDRALAQR